MDTIITFLTLGTEITSWQEVVGVVTLWLVTAFGGIYLPVKIGREEGLLVIILSAVPLLPLSFFIGMVSSFATVAMLGG